MIVKDTLCLRQVQALTNGDDSCLVWRLLLASFIKAMISDYLTIKKLSDRESWL